MYNKIDPTKILFLDIECVSGKPTFEELNGPLADLWRVKAARLLRVDELTDEEVAAVYQDKAAIFSEFGKVVCISVGILTGAPGEEQLRVKSIANADERELLDEFATLVSKSQKLIYFCGHNIKEFDIPYIGRRMLINGMVLPESLDLRGRKPWESKHLLDTMEMWSFGDRKNWTSLKLLAALFGIPSPKDDIDGSQVGRVYWEEEINAKEGGLDRIAKYCEKDVIATTNVYMALTNRKLLAEDDIKLVDR